MEWYEAVILGIVQGLTEFLPVSSSGHLAIGRELLGIEAPEDLVFEIAVHAATVLATIAVFRRQIFSLLAGLLRFRYNDETDYILKIGVATVPVFIVGIFFKDFVYGMFGSLTGVAAALLVTAVLLLFSDFASKIPGKYLPSVPAAEYRNGISYWQAFIVGLGQAFAVAPGLSRSGTTISAGLICGVRRDVIAQFSFLMVIVPVLGEAFLDVVGGEAAASSVGLLPLCIGFVSAFVSGLFACRAMVAIVRKAKLGWFALYCAVVAILIFIFK